MTFASRPAARLCSALLLVFLLALSACDGDGGGSGESGGDPASSPAPGEPGEPAPDDGGTGTGTGTDGTPGASGAPAPGGGAARFNLIASPDNAECTYVPNGHLSGADLLNAHFYFLIIGGNPPDAGAVRVSGQSDTGLSASYSSAPHNHAESVAQFALRPEDFGRSHAITLTVDSAGQVPETDESDNRIRVTLSLPSPRPSSPVDPLPCSVTRA